jgi:hypothetical protein
MAKSEIYLNNLGRKQAELTSEFSADVLAALRLNA